jgi:hypothetical protein
MRKREEMIGKRFGRLTVVGFHGVKKHHAQWLCQCDCGLTTLSYAYQLNSGSKKSCGCLRIEEASKHIPPAMKGDDNPTYKHGGKSGGIEPLYTTWWNMLKRCETPSSNRYHCYGGRGIKVCEEWHEYALFRKWAYANGYYEQDADTPRRYKLSIDRINPDGNYEPGNCRWITVSENASRRNLHANQR